MQSRTEFASPVSLKNFNHSLMSTGLNQRQINQQQLMQSLNATDLAPSEAFVANSNVLKEMFNATTLTQLFSGSANSLKKIFKVSKVNFLLVCKEAIKVFKEEDGQIKQISHAHTTFNLVLPQSHNSSKEYEFKPGFSNMTDVNKGKVVQGRYCVWPVHNLRNPE